MNDIEKLKQGAKKIHLMKVSKMLTGRYYDITALNNIKPISKLNDDEKALRDILAQYHCVDFEDMDHETKELLERVTIKFISE